jgi:uncharacterized membrane protein (UPF0127 family)
MTVKAKSLGFLGSIVGLICRREPVFFFSPFGVHTFFVKTPIDVVLVDKKLRIIRIYCGIKPFRILLWKYFWVYVLEAESGFASRHRLKRGSKVTII